MKKQLTVIIGLALVLGLIRLFVPAIAVFAKSDTAPGQAKKTETVKTVNEHAAANGMKTEEKTTGQAMKETKQLQASVTAEMKTKEVHDFLAVKTKLRKEERLGAEKLRDYLRLESTDSAMIPRNLKLKKMEVLAASAGAQLKRHAVSGIITAVADGVVTISHRTHADRTWNVYFNANTVIHIKDMTSATGADLKVGMMIAAVGTPAEGDGILATRIHVIPAKAFGVYEKQPPASGSGEPDMSPTPEVSVSATPALTPTEAASPSPSLSPTPIPTP